MINTLMVCFPTGQIKCCCLFSTHYAMLTDEYASDSAVSNYHMACEVDEKTQSVTFLYRFVPVCQSISSVIECVCCV
jgi:DNA mismatch repair ATPase MutS